MDTVQNKLKYVSLLFLISVLLILPMLKHWAIPLGIVAVILATFALIKNPYLGLVMPFCGVFFVRSVHMAVGIKMNMLSWALLMLFLALSVIMFLIKKPEIINFKFNSGLWLTLIFFAFYLIYYFKTTSPSPYSIKWYFHGILLCIIPMISLTMCIRTKEQTNKLIRAYLIIVAVMLIISAIKFKSMSMGFMERFNLVEGPPISYGRSLAIGAIFSVWLFNRYKQYLSKIIALAIFFGCLFFLLKTGTRGSLIGLAIGLLVYLMFWKVPIWKKVGISAIFLGTAAYFVRTGIAFLMIQRIEFAIKSLELSVMIRIHLYRMAWEQIKKDPIFGLGSGNYYMLLREIFVKNGNIHPHNLTLEIWVELGIIGLLIYLTIVLITSIKAWILIKRYRQNNSHNSEMGLALASFFVFSISVSQISGNFAWNFVLWISIALVHIYYELTRERNEINLKSVNID